MIVLHDFTPCVDDELEVKRGQIVNILYRENDWVYIIGMDSKQEGFIPHSYCAPYNTHLADLAVKKKLPRNGTLPGVADNQLSDYNESDNHQTDGGSQNNLKHSQASLISSEPDFLPFSKDPSGRYIVLYTFIARDENDVSVERGEFVTVLNKEDVDWYWIVRSDGGEGFVPSAFVFPAENILQNQESFSTSNLNNANIGCMNSNGVAGANFNSTNLQAASSNQNFTLPPILNSQSSQQQLPQIVHDPATLSNETSDDARFQGTELVMLVTLYDYKAQAPDDLSVRRGEIIYADLSNQTVEGWIWAYAPKTNKKCGKYGFIPKTYLQPYRQNTSV